jgi:hypothetical protein
VIFVVIVAIGGAVSAYQAQSGHQVLVGGIAIASILAVLGSVFTDAPGTENKIARAYANGLERRMMSEETQP